MNYLDSYNIFSGKNMGENKSSKSETETPKMWKHLGEGTTPRPAIWTESGNTCFNKLALCRNNCQHVNRITVKSEWISKLFQTAKSKRCQCLLWTLQKYFLQPTLLFQLQLRNSTLKGQILCKFHHTNSLLKVREFLGDFGVIALPPPCLWKSAWSLVKETKLALYSDTSVTGTQDTNIIYNPALKSTLPPRKPSKQTNKNIPPKIQPKEKPTKPQNTPLPTLQLRSHTVSTRFQLGTFMKVESGPDHIKWDNKT